MWVKLDDKMPSHPKIVKAGSRAAWLLVASICYANEYRTGGYVPVRMLRRLTDESRPAALAEKLVESGLFEPVDGGFMIHDYADFQLNFASASPSDLTQKRADAGRKGGLTSGKNRRDRSKIEANVEANDEAKPKQNRSPVPVNPGPSQLADNTHSVVGFASFASAPPPGGRVDQVRLSKVWKDKAGLRGMHVPGISEAALLLETYCREADRHDVMAVAERAIDVLIAYCASRSPGYRPIPHGDSLIKHWLRLQPVIEGRAEIDVAPQADANVPILVSGLDFRKGQGES
jgi:hypothetical protein